MAPEHPVPGYHEALGQFVDAFAAAEEMARITMWTIARVDVVDARVIWPRLMVSTSINNIRALFVERGQPLPPELDGALTHLEKLSGVRNTVLHYGAYPDANGRFTTTTWRYSGINPPDKLRQYPITPAMLSAMTHDLAVVTARLATYFDPPSDPAHAEARAEAEATAKLSFRYTPETQTPKGRASA
jgi:hypothetical protein